MYIYIYICIYIYIYAFVRVCVCVCLITVCFWERGVFGKGEVHLHIPLVLQIGKHYMQVLGALRDDIDAGKLREVYMYIYCCVYTCKLIQWDHSRCFFCAWL